VICNASELQGSPQICTDGFNGVYITWKDYRVFGYPIDSDIYAQRINSLGIPYWITNGATICNACNFQSEPQICCDTSKNAIISWMYYRIDGYPNNADIYAQKIEAGGVVKWRLNGIIVCNASDSQ